MVRVAGISFCYNRRMTNEEIEKKTREVVAKIKSALHTGQIEDAVFAGMFELVSQAYEEAEQILDRRGAIADDGDVDTGGAVRAAFDEASLEIRALKDSLSPEPVAST